MVSVGISNAESLASIKEYEDKINGVIDEKSKNIAEMITS
jgi:hypothetical protein